ncbi:hypothetical protein J7E87_28365 [Streptomyces sp. ISL-1]|uniref:hypothetical protein n=1 Tax=Streptomyces sp. ISL-1 TaxID=2817657 RepID=UPI001BE55FA5|nr:hypothetical protein [Streptomyces sp. ISL-1]MBT2393237.1 hypothetical protein [Streptomyces sp. ISL-1]
MRAIRVASLALIGTAALTVGAPAAVAADGSDLIPPGFTVTPSTAAPGGTVTLNATECAVPPVTVSSGVFDTVTLDEGHSGTAKIDARARPGTEDEVTFECNGEKVTTPLTISGGSESPREDGTGTGTGTGAKKSPSGVETETETLPDALTETGTEADTGDSHTETEGETGDPSAESEAKAETGRPHTKTDTGDSYSDTKTDTGDSHTGKGTSHTGTGTTKPGAGVHAGAGGSFAELSPAQIAVGSALVAGGVLGGGVLLLRRGSGEGV